MLSISSAVYAVLALVSVDADRMSCWVTAAEVDGKMQYQGRILSKEDARLQYRLAIAVEGEGGNRSHISQSGYVEVQGGVMSSAGMAQLSTSGATQPSISFEVMNDVERWTCLTDAVAAQS